MNEKQRVQILGGVTVLVLAVGAVKLFKKGSDDVVAPVTKGERGGIASPSSASLAKTYGDLARVYKPINEADPFRHRLFVKPNRGGGGRGRDREPEVAAPSSATPMGVTLRLTGIVQDDGGLIAILEDRVQGKGAFVHKGEKLGRDRTVAEIKSSSIVIGPLPGSVAAVRTSTYEFNDKLDLPVEAVDTLLRAYTFAAPSTATSAGSSGSGGSKLPELDEEKKKSVLEQLKEKRKKSLGQDQPKDEGKPK